MGASLLSKLAQSVLPPPERGDRLRFPFLPSPSYGFFQCPLPLFPFLTMPLSFLLSTQVFPLVCVSSSVPGFVSSSPLPFPRLLRLDPLGLAPIQRHTFLIPGSFSACSAPALRSKEDRAGLPPKTGKKITQRSCPESFCNPEYG